MPTIFCSFGAQNKIEPFLTELEIIDDVHKAQPSCPVFLYPFFISERIELGSPAENWLHRFGDHYERFAGNPRR